jgi:hypothetical protein
MTIKKGLHFWFCSNCGHHITKVSDEEPRFCLACMGTAGGVHLNDDTFVFLKTKIEKAREESDNEAVESLNMKLAVLYLERVTIYEAGIHSLPDGDDKNYKCKQILDDLNQMARKIHILLVHEEPKTFNPFQENKS